MKKASQVILFLILGAGFLFRANEDTSFAEAGASLDRSGTQWSPYLEWSFNNPTHSGNAYDLIATATFTHASSGEKRTTEMFYDGADTWKLRFTATRSGTWTFTTTSADSDLDGKSGTVTIQANPGEPGFVTNFGNKWGRTGTDEAFVPQFVMYASPESYLNRAGKIDNDLNKWFGEHGFNGLHTIVGCGWFDISENNCQNLSSNNPNPDRETFAALELLITKVYKAGGVVHIWPWGDEQRGMTPTRYGINGTVDKRLQRYISARLGPLPGWTMGYGFDLNEWVTESQLRVWYAYMQDHMGWSHYLGARSEGPNQYEPGVNFPQIYEGLDYASYEQHKPMYDAYVATLAARPGKPAFSEDRFRIRDRGDPKDYDMQETRQGLWASYMAGGVAGIWGNLLGVQIQWDGSVAYPNPEWIKTNALFFEDRFLKDLQRCNSLTDGYCLRGPSNSNFIFYRENTSSIQMDLSKMAGAQPAIAVDAKKAYQEIDVGSLNPQDQTWIAPYKSDWAIAVGAFGNAARQPTFLDVPFEHWAHDEIELLYQQGYIAGCGMDPLLYCPEASMTRAESAVFVERGIHGAGYTPKQPTQTAFADVPLWEWFAKWSNALWEDGYTAGCGTDPLIYCPLQKHTRTEGAVFFLRMLMGSNYVPPAAVGVFSDVPTTFWGAKWIEAAYDAGLIPACETTPDLLFCLDDPLDRAMGAYMMVQAKGLATP